MEFRVLGPLEVAVDGRSLRPRGAKRLALLAALVIRANQVVPEDVLLEELWGRRPPASGKTALRMRVSQLRRALGEAGARVVTRGPGYVLEVDESEVDAHRFERLLAAGRDALRLGDPAGAAEALAGALALWRGEPLADVAYEPFAQGAIARLRELRLAAIEERIEAELALARHAELVGELEALVAEHPHRERLRGQLMTALYRTGRQADALAVYRAGREALVEEIGLEPGPALQGLERAILRHDPSLDLPDRPDAGRTRLVPEERKLVTVVSVGFTGPASDDPERTRAALGELQAAVTVEVEAADGRIETVAGDAITAAFGVPASREDHAVRALQAALALRNSLGKAARIGVEAGDAVFSPGSSGTTVVGGAVTAAARLARSAAPGAIAVGERVAAAAHGAFELGPPAEDGSRPLLRASATTRRPGAGPRAVLVGRRDELAALRAAYRATVADGRPRLVTVAGDAGVGKTRLVQELHDALAREETPPRVHVGRCLPYRRGSTYLPLAEVLRGELELRDDEPPEPALERLGELRVLGVTLGLDAAPEVHPHAIREQLEEAWVGFLRERARERPRVLVLEDLHWAQEALLDLVERLHDAVSAPLLLVVTGRPELVTGRPTWGRRADASTLWLEPLSREDAERLLELLGGEAIAPELRAQVLARAEGNPFFLEELVQAAPSAVGVPDSVQAVLAGRIDLLPPREKAALQAAAVIGRAFWETAVCELLDGDCPDFTLLEAHDFIRRRAGSALGGDREFVFKHVLTWEVAYGSLTAAGRARLHAAFADWLARTGGARDDRAALLARHYAESVRPEDADLAWQPSDAEAARLRGRAVHWLGRAAALAVRRYELDDAVAMLERALALDPDDAMKLELWRGMGRAHALRHDGDAFVAALENAIPLSGDRATTAELWADLAFEAACRTGMWRQRPARELVDGWIDRALELAEPGSATRARALIARCIWAPFGSVEEAREASAIAERLGDPVLRSYAWDARGITMWVAGEPDLGRAFEERRFELVDEIGDPEHVADIHYAPITGCVWLGYLGEARRLAEAHDTIVQGLTPHHRIHGLAVLTELEELVGDWDAIRALRSRVATVVLPNRDTPCMRSPRILLVSAAAELRAGNAERARELEELAEEFRVEGFGHTISTPKLRLALVRGDLEQAERLVAEPIPDRGWHRAWLLLATQATRLDALAALGRRREVEEWPAPRPRTYLEPFHLRSLGLVRHDEESLRAAIRGFERLRLDLHARETAALLG